jgi:hypothetical protein
MANLHALRVRSRTAREGSLLARGGLSYCLCRMLLCFPVIRLHRDAASRTIDADRLEGLRCAVASMSCLVVCSSQKTASQGVLIEQVGKYM